MRNIRVLFPQALDLCSHVAVSTVKGVKAQICHLLQLVLGNGSLKSTEGGKGGRKEREGRICSG